MKFVCCTLCATYALIIKKNCFLTDPTHKMFFIIFWIKTMNQYILYKCLWNMNDSWLSYKPLLNQNWSKSCHSCFKVILCMCITCRRFFSCLFYFTSCLSSWIPIVHVYYRSLLSIQIIFKSLCISIYLDLFNLYVFVILLFTLL